MKRPLKLPMWMVPLAIAAVVAVFGWWGNVQLKQTIQGQLKAELASTLNANVTALEIWTTNQGKLAMSLADEPEVRNLALRIFARFKEAGGDGKKLEDSAEVEALANYLRPLLKKIGYGMANLVSTNFFVVANSMGNRARPVHEDHAEKFAELFASGRPVIITPFKARPPSPAPPGAGRGAVGPEKRRRSSEAPLNRFPNGPSPPPNRGTDQGPEHNRPQRTESGRSRRGDLTMMQVAAPILDSAGVVQGALALIINPDAEFTRILSVARSGESGETYAFDQHGLMISRSRFDDQLRRLGLIEDRPGASSALNLRLSEPDPALPRAFKVEPPDVITRPLTRIVADAVAGGSGVDVAPGLDYRGIPVVGAWQWMPQHGFGVATQIDATEGYQPLRILKLIFVMLFLLLLLCASGMFVFSYSNSLWRRRFSEAELKLKQLGQYTLEEKIGEGGMGVVYRAHHALMRRETAVKLLLPERADRDSIQHFEREVRLTCQLTHPNTIQVFDYGRTPEGIFYYAMEFLRGLNLHDLVARFGAQPEARVIHILVQVCDSLAEAHALGLVHRDIKPANVFLCNRGGVPDWVKVLDFGLVRQYRDAKGSPQHLTGEQVTVGTPSFMPPEAIKNSNRSDPRSDIYSVGALGYYLLTATNVFDAESVFDLYEKHLTESPVPPSQRAKNPITAPLEETILLCLNKEPDRRPQSVSELRALLLASPRALDWGAQEKAAWWAVYPGQIKSPQSETQRSTGNLDATVRIDFAKRLE